jgi:polyribonucleotide nucleotidyltransferase
MASVQDYRVFKTAVGGRLLQLEFGKICGKANGQALVRYGDSVVSVTVCASDEPRPDIDFFPLSCNYEEKMYAMGKIPGGFLRREGRPSEKATLSSRLMDRPLRPLFPKGYYNDVVVVATVLSVDLDCETDILAMIGSSAALAVSDIPWGGPTGSVRVGRVNGRLIINPTLEERENSDINLTVAGTEDAIMMVEAGADEVPEEEMMEAIFFAHDEIKKIVAFLDDIVKEVGKSKQDFEAHTVPEDIASDIREYASPKMRDAMHVEDKDDRLKKIDEVKSETHEYFSETYPDSENDVESVLFDITKEEMRKRIIEEGVRLDNRKPTEIRPIWCETSVLPRTHGSGIFTRGETQALSVCTLAPLSEAQMIDGITEDTEKRYMHHYNFPGYCTGEAKSPRSPGRREIGHGALAERALIPVIPSEEDFPYAIRVVSEILSSNGSSSMASTCGSCLALMDAGVPIKKPVAGIAMGLIEPSDEEKEDYVILSDIQGMEDFMGDMDFKVTGTEDGVTAMQMDIKIHGLSQDILRAALEQEKEGRMFIMGKMLEELPEPRQELSKYAPRSVSMMIDPDKIRLVIGPGGKTINRIVEETGAKVDIDEDNSGRINIYSADLEGLEAAKKEIELLTKDVEVGETYLGEVKRVVPFGAFIEILPGKEGLLHISKMADYHVDKVEDVMNVGDKVEVKVYEIDNQNRINLLRADLENDKRTGRKPANGGRKRYNR